LVYRKSRNNSDATPVRTRSTPTKQVALTKQPPGLLTILLNSIGNTNTNINFKKGLQYQYQYFLVLLKQYQYLDRSVFNINHAVSQHKEIILLR